MKSRLTPYTTFCAKLRQQQLLRHLPHDRKYQYDFSTNDYLGLSQHSALIKAASDAAQQGVGSKASRLITSTQQALKTLEENIAHTKNHNGALLFATGYQANLSILSALLDRKVLGHPPLVFADRLNHASMHAGCELAKAKQLRFRHLDYDHLAWLLNNTRNERRQRFILTESVFGMDGDVADLRKVSQLAKQYDALLYVDEAHATGIFGQQGYGLTADFGDEIDISMGTFSKALGSSGAYITCSHALKRYFVNRSGGLIYSTAPSPMQVATMHTAWSLIPSLQPQAKALLAKAHRLKQALQKLGFDVGGSTTHIIPLVLRSAKETLSAQQSLAKNNIRVSAIRPPSVPIDQSRLRIALTTLHDDEGLSALLRALTDFVNSFSPFTSD
ncbi:MAG: aminotransferase class I/II-fold pyridoxal phosphate-dependent enzyme [Candidatus Berkiellales bacterium]